VRLFAYGDTHTCLSGSKQASVCANMNAAEQRPPPPLEPCSDHHDDTDDDEDPAAAAAAAAAAANNNPKEEDDDDYETSNDQEAQGSLETAGENDNVDEDWWCFASLLHNHLAHSSLDAASTSHRDHWLQQWPLLKRTIQNSLAQTPSSSLPAAAAAQQLLLALTCLATPPFPGTREMHKEFGVVATEREVFTYW
jgi:hypothetical protein